MHRTRNVESSIQITCNLKRAAIIRNEGFVSSVLVSVEHVMFEVLNKVSVDARKLQVSEA